MYNYFTITKGLDNLLLVFAPTGDVAEWIPPYSGNTYGDIVAPIYYSEELSPWPDDVLPYGKIIGMSEMGLGGGNKVDNMQFLTTMSKILSLLILLLGKTNGVFRLTMMHLQW